MEKEDLRTSSSLDSLLKPKSVAATKEETHSSLGSLSTTTTNGKSCRLVRSFAIKEMSPPPAIHEKDGNGHSHPAAKDIAEDTIVEGQGQQYQQQQQQQQHSNSSHPHKSFHYFNPHHNGINIKEFLRETVNKSAKDCNLLLKLEADIISFIQAHSEDLEEDQGDSSEKRSIPTYKFQQMSSYQRMLLHRLAAYYSLDHNLDATNQCVVISMNPAVGRAATAGVESLCDMLNKCNVQGQQQQQQQQGHQGQRDNNPITKILPRRTTDNSDKNSIKQQQKKSYEERNIDYYNIRKKIFHNNPMTILNSGEEIQQDKEKKHEGGWQHSHDKRMLKVGSLEVEQHNNASKEPISKSYSFGGISCSNSFDSGSAQYTPSQHGKHAKLLNRNNTFGTSSSSIYSNSLSPASSGYKSQSFEITQSTSSPSQTPPLPSTPIVGLNAQGQGQKSMNELGGVLWAVTDLAAVPHGAILIDPTTGKPLQNPDGSLYHFDSANPPNLIHPQQYSGPAQPPLAAPNVPQCIYYPSIPLPPPNPIYQPMQIYNETEIPQQYLTSAAQAQFVPMGMGVIGSATPYGNQMVQIIGNPGAMAFQPQQSPHPQYNAGAESMMNYSIPQIITPRPGPGRYYHQGQGQPMNQLCSSNQYRFQYIQSPVDLHQSGATVIHQHNGREELLIAAAGAGPANFQQTLQQSNTSVQVQPIILTSGGGGRGPSQNRHFYPGNTDRNERSSWRNNKGESPRQK